jgi:hypothetical protein
MSRVRRGVLASAAAAALLAVTGASAGAATSAPASQTVLFSNQSAVQLKLNPSTYNFGKVTPLTTATSAAGANTARVYSNEPWQLEVNGSGVFSDGGSPVHTIPDSRMTISGNGGAPITLSSAPGSMATGTATPKAGVKVALIYALTLQWTDPVSTQAYTDTLTYTAYTP